MAAGEAAGEVLQKMQLNIKKIQRSRVQLRLDN